MSRFHPRLVDELRSYDGEKFLRDLSAGLTVAAVALPRGGTLHGHRRGLADLRPGRLARADRRTLHAMLQKRGGALMLCGLQKQPRWLLRQAGLAADLGPDNVVETLADAFRRAGTLTEPA